MTGRPGFSRFGCPLG